MPFMDVKPQFGSATSTSFLIETTRLSDLRAVLELSETLGFSGQAWRKLIAGGTAVCARDGDAVVGFYTANHLSLIYQAPQLEELRAAMRVLCNRFKLAEELIAFGALSVVAVPYGSTNLRAQMLRALLRSVGLRYQRLFTYCRKQDPAELDTLVREGWRCFQEEDETCYLTLEVGKTLRRLASELVFSTRVSAQPLGPHLPAPRNPIPTTC